MAPTLAALYRPHRIATGGIAVPANPFRGLDLRADPKYMPPGKLLQAQNFVPYQQGVASKRKGCTFLNATAWAGVTRVPWAVRYYVSASTRYKIAVVSRAAGDQVVRIDDTTGAMTVLTGMPTAGANKRWRGVVAMESPTLYVGNDTDALMKSTDGTSIAVLTGTQIPTKGYMGGPFFDRLLCWTGKRLYYSRANLDTNWSNPTTGNAMYLFVNHPEDISVAFLPGPDRTEVGFLGKLYVCTPTSTWVHHQDFDQGQGTPISNFTKVHERAGIAARAFNTIAWTDQGAIGMGSDNIWFFPIAGMPVSIGEEVAEVIKAIPAASRERCSAVYRHPFYMLSYVRDGQTNPDRELWADVRSIKHITWWGPMVRANIGIECWMLQSQQPDQNELFGFGATEGRAMQCEASVYTDAGVSMLSILQTADLGGDMPGRKVMKGHIIGSFVAQNDQIVVKQDVDEGFYSASQTVLLTNPGALFDSGVFDTAVFGGDIYQKPERFWPAPRTAGSKVRLTITHSSASNFSLKELAATMLPLGRQR